MKLSRTAIHVYRRDGRIVAPAGARAAVSLHSHSECSREKLDVLPRIARGIPLVAAFFERSMQEYQRRHGRPLDFNTVYWRPPLAPEAVVASERAQIERRFDCDALISLTDHDTLEGPRTLRALGKGEVPLSVEWSILFDSVVFHLGVHGISPARLDETERVLAAHTAEAKDDIGELLDWLGECPETFVVLNHPYWDMFGIGGLRYDAVLLAFLRAHRHRIHALELNGYRTWAENRRVLPLAEGFGLPVVGGGDRHGYTPNTIVNLTSATCLAEFARELREGTATDCVVFPEYAEPHTARVLQTAGHILQHVPQHHRGRRRWSERVFVMTDGEERSLDSMWSSAPWWLNGALTVTRWLGSDSIRPLFELTRADGQHTLTADCRPEPVFGRPQLEIPRSAAAV